MHVIFRETHGIEEASVPQDLGQTPADLVILSFSDSDLGAFAAAWRQARAAGKAMPTLRLANLAALTHPLSVDTYIDATLRGAKAILIRLIGGASYWQYGLQQVEALAQTQRIALAVLPGDGAPDARLTAASTIAAPLLEEMARACESGGAESAHYVIGLLARAAGLAEAADRSIPLLPMLGGWTGGAGPSCPAAFALTSMRPRLLLIFYRSYFAAADVEPFAALRDAFCARGYDLIGLFIPSLKPADVATWVARWVLALEPAAILNATAFSALKANGGTPLDGAGVPVFQIALATSSRQAWLEASRGLSPADLAMHVVLPEVDGRLFAGVASFKEAEALDPLLQFSRNAHRSDSARIAAIADRIDGWVRLAQKPASEKRLALILSTYPGKAHQMAHAVGLDALASAEAMLVDLAAQEYDTAPGEALSECLQIERLHWPVDYYRRALAALPQKLQQEVQDNWGPAEQDEDVRNGAFHFAAVRRGKVLVALQPERGRVQGREDSYHDLSHCPRHAYIAFYLWLRAQGFDALVHIGAHGTLEWLPGKAVALSNGCWPDALAGAMPIIYPFIVNDPGEAAQAKRRTAALTLGHAPPPLVPAARGAGLGRIEALLDEFSNAEGLDPARRRRLQDDIGEEAALLGLEAELELSQALSPAEMIGRIDRFVCDVKESQFGDGLHIFGRGEQGLAERDGLLAALAGRWVAPGPSGSPHRGRLDVLPTGRNLFMVDPRAVPSRTAYDQGVRLAEELIRRHLQDHGDYPRTLVVDLWGSATMRTAGEDYAMALHLLGARPLWDMASERVTGVEILPLALLDRPRLDVTLRVSGLFRDAFPTLPVLFGQAVRALAQRDEPRDWNPFVGTIVPQRVYGPAPGDYGVSMGDAIEQFGNVARQAAGEAWLAASSHALGLGDAVEDKVGLVERVAAADSFVHMQDLPETDLLLSADYAAHEGGFAAAQEVTGGKAALYHLNARDAAKPVARSLTEEIARVVRARAANPVWIDGMMRHGFRGGAEIAATLDHLGAFAQLTGQVPSQLFDLYHDATLGRPEVLSFLSRTNPGALAAMQARFAALHAAGLWITRRNSIVASLEASA